MDLIQDVLKIVNHFVRSAPGAPDRRLTAWFFPAKMFHVGEYGLVRPQATTAFLPFARNGRKKPGAQAQDYHALVHFYWAAHVGRGGAPAVFTQQ